MKVTIFAYFKDMKYSLLLTFIALFLFTSTGLAQEPHGDTATAAVQPVRDTAGAAAQAELSGAKRPLVIPECAPCVRARDNVLPVCGPGSWGHGFCFMADQQSTEARDIHEQHSRD